MWGVCRNPRVASGNKKVRMATQAHVDPWAARSAAGEWTRLDAGCHPTFEHPFLEPGLRVGRCSGGCRRGLSMMLRFRSVSFPKALSHCGRPPTTSVDGSQAAA